MENIIGIQLRKQELPKPVEKKDTKGWLKYGPDNLYPEFIFGLYQNCSLLQSVINGIADYVAGAGITDEFLADDIVNSKHETLLTVILKCVVDYVIFGAFSVQVLRNQFGNVTELYWIDVRKVRLGNEDNEDTIYYCKDWSNNQKKKFAYKMNDDFESTSIYYFKDPTSRNEYGNPSWSAAVNAVQTYVEIQNFHLNEVRNNFSPAALIAFHGGVPDDETKKKMQHEFEEKFTGTENAAKIMITFDDSKENGVEVQKISEDNYADRYNTLMNNVTSSIYSAFRATPTLFGLLDQSTGFNSQEYKESFALFNTTVIAPIQKEIERGFKQLGYEIKLNKFKIDFE